MVAPPPPPPPPPSPPPSHLKKPYVMESEREGSYTSLFIHRSPVLLTPSKFIWPILKNKSVVLKGQCHEMNIFMKVLKFEPVLFGWALMVFTAFSWYFVKEIQKKFLLAPMKSLTNCENCEIVKKCLIYSGNKRKFGNFLQNTDKVVSSDFRLLIIWISWICEHLFYDFQILPEKQPDVKLSQKVF